MWNMRVARWAWITNNWWVREKGGIVIGRQGILRCDDERTLLRVIELITKTCSVVRNLSEMKPNKIFSTSAFLINVDMCVLPEPGWTVYSNSGYNELPLKSIKLHEIMLSSRQICTNGSLSKSQKYQAKLNSIHHSLNDYEVIILNCPAGPKVARDSPSALLWVSWSPPFSVSWTKP